MKLLFIAFASVAALAGTAHAGSLSVGVGIALPAPVVAPSVVQPAPAEVLPPPAPIANSAPVFVVAPAYVAARPAVAVSYGPFYGAPLPMRGVVVFR